MHVHVYLSSRLKWPRGPRWAVCMVFSGIYLVTSGLTQDFPCILHPYIEVITDILWLSQGNCTVPMWYFMSLCHLFVPIQWPWGDIEVTMQYSQWFSLLTIALWWPWGFIEVIARHSGEREWYLCGAAVTSSMWLLQASPSYVTTIRKPCCHYIICKSCSKSPQTPDMWLGQPSFCDYFAMNCTATFICGNYYFLWANVQLRRQHQ